jgi:hypothetical protein
MADTTTPNYSFVQPQVGGSTDTWGTKLNANWLAADAAIKANADAAAAAQAAVDALTFTASEVSYNNATSGLTATDVQAAIDESLGLSNKVIGEVFALWDHITGVSAPDNSGDAKYVRLTAADAYNTGLLTGESVASVSISPGEGIGGPTTTVEATATIATGPLTGQTVHLINTEESFLRPRETSGILQFDDLRSHQHALDAQRDAAEGSDDNNAEDGAPQRTWTGFTGGDETRPKNVSATFYMRIA